jgi:hypothetical protein
MALFTVFEPIRDLAKEMVEFLAPFEKVTPVGSIMPFVQIVIIVFEAPFQIREIRVSEYRAVP